MVFAAADVEVGVFGAAALVADAGFTVFDVGLAFSAAFGVAAVFFVSAVVATTAAATDVAAATAASAAVALDASGVLGVCACCSVGLTKLHSWASLSDSESTS